MAAHGFWPGVPRARVARKGVGHWAARCEAVMRGHEDEASRQPRGTDSPPETDPLIARSAHQSRTRAGQILCTPVSPFEPTHDVSRLLANLRAASAYALSDAP